MPARCRSDRSGPSNAGTRTEMLVPLAATGARTACTRTPLSSRTSTHGDASSRCRPPSAIRCTARRRTSASVACHDVTRSTPSPRSTNSPRSPLTKRSVTPGSSRKGRRKATAGSSVSTAVASKPLPSGARRSTTTTVELRCPGLRAGRGERWMRREHPFLGRNKFGEARPPLVSESRRRKKKGGGIPTVGGEGCRHAPGKIGGLPRRECRKRCSGAS